MKTLSLVVCIIVFTKCYAQTSWTRFYGEQFKDAGVQMIMSSDSNYVVSGVLGYNDTTGGWFANNTGFVVSVDQNGSTNWSRKFQIPFVNNLTTPYTIIELKVGGFVLAGAARTNDTLSGTSDSFIMRLDNNGDSLWTVIFRDTLMQNGTIYSLNETADSNLIFLGYLTENSAKIYKTDTIGSVIWDLDTLVGIDFKVTSDTGLVLVRSEGPLFSEYTRIIKTNDSGKIVWDRSYPELPDDFEHPRQIIETKDKGFIVRAAPFNLLRLDQDGDTLWTKIGSGFGSATSYDIIETSDSGFIVLGTRTNIQLDMDLYLLRINNQGKVIWESTLTSIGDDQTPVNILEAIDGGFIILASTGNGLNGDDDLLIVKTDSTGKVVGIKPVLVNNDEINLYPNPSSGSFRVELSGNEDIIIKVFDTKGRLIKSIHEAKNKVAEINIQGAEGIYYVQVFTPSNVATRKLLITNNQKQ